MISVFLLNCQRTIHQIISVAYHFCLFNRQGKPETNKYSFEACSYSHSRIPQLTNESQRVKDNDSAGLTPLPVQLFPLPRSGGNGSLRLTVHCELSASYSVFTSLSLSDANTTAIKTNLEFSFYVISRIRSHLEYSVINTNTKPKPHQHGIPSPEYHQSNPRQLHSAASVRLTLTYTTHHIAECPIAAVSLAPEKNTAQAQHLSEITLQSSFY